MFRNYVITALRGLLRQKGYALINVAGLAIGIACSIVMLRCVQNDLTVDAMHKNGDRIYRLVETRQSPDRGTISNACGWAGNTVAGSTNRVREISLIRMPSGVPIHRRPAASSPRAVICLRRITPAGVESPAKG